MRFVVFPRAAFSAAALLLSLAGAAHAAWPHDPVTGAVPVSVAGLGVAAPAPIPDGAGGAFVAWEDNRSGLTTVYVQHLNASGVPLWGANAVRATTASGSAYTPRLVADGSGGVIVVWRDTRAGGSDIYAQRLNAAGAAQWGFGGAPICTAAGEQTQPVIATDAAGGAFIAWTDARVATSSIYAQRVFPAGTTAWPVDGVQAAAVASPNQLNPAIIADGFGQAMVAWQDLRAGNSDIYVQKFGAAGNPVYSSTGLAVCTASGAQTVPTLTTDMNGGAIVAWADDRSGTTDVYAQKVWYAGIVLWAVNGVAVTAAVGTQGQPLTFSDGAGGAIVAFMDNQGPTSGPAAQRLSGGGVTQWTSGGVHVAVSPALASASYWSAAPDARGGVLLSWTDYRANSGDTYVQRLSSAGVPQWTTAGIGAETNPSQTNEQAVCSDGAGGAIAFFTDFRNVISTNLDLWATRVDSYGVQGGEPSIAAVRDVPNDQGGRVKLSWDASPLDTDPMSPSSIPLSYYYVFRSVPPNVAAQAIAAGRVTSSFEAATRGAPADRPLFQPRDGALGYYWEFVQSVTAMHLANYSALVATAGDSTGANNSRTAFMVRALDGTGQRWWDSAPDSGYSVDNLPPAAPAPFTGQYAPAATHLHWNPNTEPDLAGYELYRGSSSGFVPSPATLVATLADSGYTDPAGAPYVYKLRAVDSHGNRSALVTLVPTGTTAVEGGAGRLALAAPSPNPVRGSARLAWTLPARGPVSLTVYDTAGRRVRTLAEGTYEAGAHESRLDLAGADALPPGLYLARLVTRAETLQQRIAVVR